MRKRSHTINVFAVVFIGSIAFLFLHAYIVGPRAQAYRRNLQTLHPDAVQSVIVKGGEPYYGHPERERLLDRDEIAAFLRLIADAVPYAPSSQRDRSVWTCTVDITAEGHPPFKLVITLGDLNGIHIGFRDEARNYGDLRNDELAQFIERMLWVPRIAPATQQLIESPRLNPGDPAMPDKAWPVDE